MLSKVLNKNTIKNSYGCLRNMKSIMSSHSKQIPLIIQLIYQADSTKNLDDIITIILDWQKQLSNNDMATTKVFLKMKIIKTSTKLSKYVLLLKENVKCSYFTIYSKYI